MSNKKKKATVEETPVALRFINRGTKIELHVTQGDKDLLRLNMSWISGYSLHKELGTAVSMAEAASPVQYRAVNPYVIVPDRIIILT